MTRLGYIFEERDGTLHFFKNRQECIEWLATEAELKRKSMYGVETTTDRMDGSRIRGCFYSQSVDEVTQD